MAESELGTQAADPRPALAVGQVELYVRSVAQTGELLVRLGVRTSSVKRDPVHSWFHLTEPSGSRLTRMSSHAGQRPV